MYSLIIKGSIITACRAARKRDVLVKAGYEIDEGPGSDVPVTHSVLFVEDDQELAVKNWFMDPGMAAPRTGYPPGACLAFTFHAGEVPAARVQLWTEAIRKEPRWREFAATSAS